MPKRRVETDSDDDAPSNNATPSSKRARTEEQASPEPDTRRGRKSAKGKQQAHDSDNEEGGEPVDEDSGDEEFERANAPNMMRHIKNKGKTQGGIAEAGIIESVEMLNFMCHKYLSFTFGPQINFIIGHNGSGKSAVLSAITIALGGKALSTGRGNGLKSFIKEGQSRAEVTLTLKNQGEEAYKPETYGSSITIRRSWTKEGSGSWKILNTKGETVSTKRDELSNICDHLNVQVDNPLNVLTQDSARQFLSSSSASDKYKFFLRGTQLSQLTQEYDTCLECINSTNRLLTVKKEAIPDLEQAFKNASIRFQEATKAREQKHKVDELKKELAWSHVALKEAELETQITEEAKEESRLKEAQSKLEQAEQQVLDAGEEVAEAETRFEAFGNVNDLHRQRDKYKDGLATAKRELNTLNTDLKTMNDQFEQLKEQIRGFDRSIDEEARKLQPESRGRHEQAQKELIEAQTRIEEADAAAKQTAKELSQADDDIRSLNRQGQSVDDEMKAIQKDIEQGEHALDRLRQSTVNKLTAYGNQMERVIQAIEKARWTGERPIGPLGIHVKVRESEQWATDILRRMLAQLLTAFAVTTAQDRETLKRILKETNNSRVPIIIYEPDLFDFSSGEPSGNYLTVLRALEISNPHVTRILVNQREIERILLARRRALGEQYLRELSRGGRCWTEDGHQLRRYPEGGESVQPVPPGRSEYAGLFPPSNNDAQKQEQVFQENLAQLKAQYQAKGVEKNRLQEQYRFARQKEAALRKADQQSHDVLRQARALHQKLSTEVKDFMPANIAGLEAAKGEVETERKALEEQICHYLTRKKALGEENRQRLTEYNAVKEKIDAFESQRAGVRQEAEAAVERRLQAQNAVKHWKGKVAEFRGKVELAHDAVKQLEQTFEDWTTKAAQYCDRVETRRKPETIQKQLDSVQKVLSEREKRHGATVEDMTIEVNKTKADLERVKSDLKAMVNLNQSLMDALIVRYTKCQEFRRHIALLTKLLFQHNLSQRGYYGKLLFDHKSQKLELRVRPQEKAGMREHEKDKDPKSLSGGEKSFSTICLLLALWSSISCPLRCLDEFDVFMDAVNRRISMEMMIESAKQADRKQYILITPQDMTNIKISNSVKVHRMSDPERGQGMLTF